MLVIVAGLIFGFVLLVVIVGPHYRNYITGVKQRDRLLDEIASTKRRSLAYSIARKSKVSAHHVSKKIEKRLFKCEYCGTRYTKNQLERLAKKKDSMNCLECGGKFGDEIEGVLDG